MTTVRLFVYGTLLSGERNHRHLAGAPLVGAARTAPRYELRHLGRYPALVRGGTQAVAGELYEVDTPTLAALDRFEDHPRLFRRTRITLDDGTRAAAYLQSRAQAAAAPVLAAGDWRERKRARSRSGRDGARPSSRRPRTARPGRRRPR